MISSEQLEETAAAFVHDVAAIQRVWIAWPGRRTQDRQSHDARL